MQVNFLALDFDLTILDIHTSGRWPGTPEQLAQRIRPFFQALIPVAVAAGKSSVWKRLSSIGLCSPLSVVFTRRNYILS